MLAKLCGTPGCALPDFHNGACESEVRCGKRPRVQPQVLALPATELVAKKRTTPKVKDFGPPVGTIAIVKRIVASATTSTGRKFACDWGYGERAISWVEEEDIDPSLVVEFDTTQLYRAPWSRGHSNGALYLIEKVLERCTQAGRAKVRWLGFAAKWDSWIDEGLLVPPEPPGSPRRADSPPSFSETCEGGLRMSCCV